MAEEKEIMSKVLVMILGGGATGKTTLSRALAGKAASEHKIELTVTEKGVRKNVKAPYVLGSNLAIAGNLKNSSDAIGAMDTLHQTIDHCWKQRDVVIMRVIPRQEKRRPLEQILQPHQGADPLVERVLKDDHQVPRANGQNAGDSE